MTARRPHLILFNPDEWRGDCLGYAGNPAARTPCLDRLAREEAVGMRWAFCQNPVCVPSRCSTMTGWYPHTRGHRSMHHLLHPEHGERNLLGILQEHGYALHWYGKNDLLDTSPDTDGRRWTDRCDAVLTWPPAAFVPEHLRDAVPALTPISQQRAHDFPFSHYHGPLQSAANPSGALAYHNHDWACIALACEAIERWDGGAPLCLHLPLFYPHPPYGVEEPWFSAIDRELVEQPLRFAQRSGSRPAMLDAYRERTAIDGWSPAERRELRAVYHAMCHRVDDQLQQVVDALQRRGIWDDSMLMVYADHGDFCGDDDLVEKAENLFPDALARVPFLIKPPKGIPVRPRVSDALVELIDLPATIYDLLAIDPGYDHFGRSLLPLLSGDCDQHRDAVFCEGGRLPHEHQATGVEPGSTPKLDRGYGAKVGLQLRSDGPFHGKAVMCREHDWKYIYRLQEPDELYQLRADPDERHNRIDDPACRETLGRLRERTLRWMVETADVLPRRLDSRV